MKTFQRFACLTLSACLAFGLAARAAVHQGEQEEEGPVTVAEPEANDRLVALVAKWVQNR